MRAQVLFGINNIYTVDVDGREMQCRIKGKVLKASENYYNPLAPGDIVEIVQDGFTQGLGWIISREERRNYFERWNRKKKSPQTIAANVDLFIIISSAASPPFRPRFIDRLLVCSEVGGIPPLILVNKHDLGLDGEAEERLDFFKEIGYELLYCSALTGQGIDDLAQRMEHKTVLFAGQSGVGKTSILNRIDPSLQLKVGEISAKYDRGVHTTNYAVMVTVQDRFRVIDTPGIRELNIPRIEPADLRFYFKEFGALQEKCAYPSCVHLNEPACAVKEALARGIINADRYQCYLKVYEDLIQIKKMAYG